MTLKSNPIIFAWLFLAVSQSAWAVKLKVPQGPAHAFPVMRQLDGKLIANGEFTQVIEKGILRVRLEYRLSANHRILEESSYEQTPNLVQRDWDWQEFRDSKIVRRYRVDFKTGIARAEKAGSKDGPWEKKLKTVPGKAFAGFGFALALSALRDSLVKGEKIELQGVGFSPKPRLGEVGISYAGTDRMTMAGRVVKGERFLIRAKVPEIAKLFIHLADTKIWLTTPPPSGFLRWEGSLVELTDPVVRVDLMPGPVSGPAEPLP